MSCEDFIRIYEMMKQKGVFTDAVTGKPYYTGYEYATLYDWDLKRLCQEISSAPGTPTHVFQELGKYGYSELAAAENMHVLLNKEGKGKGMV